MDEDRLYDWAAQASAQIVNLHLHEDPCMRFNAVLSVLLAVLRLAAMEQREAMLRPNKN